jgi:hypothetical protein
VVRAGRGGGSLRTGRVREATDHARALTAAGLAEVSPRAAMVVAAAQALTVADEARSPCSSGRCRSPGLCAGPSSWPGYGCCTGAPAASAGHPRRPGSS